MTSDTESTLDPADWNQYRRTAHELLDSCIDRLEHARELPWRAPHHATLNAHQPLPVEGEDMQAVASQLVNDILPYATGNAHPRFFGWVHGAGLSECLLADIVASTMNSNCGGRDHGAVYIERCVVNWCNRIFGMPETSGGIVTSGTSMATILALSSARVKLLSDTVRKTGMASQPRLAVYGAAGTHSCIGKALSLMGLGSDAFRAIPIDPSTHSICIEMLERTVDDDVASGVLPLAVVGTAGTVDSGRFDSLDSLADFCHSRKLWFHVDGAFGAWAILAEAPHASLVAGIERADSIATDFHKWLSVQYDAGALLVRDEDGLRRTFAERPAYLESGGQALAGGDPWYCDSGVELSRGFRALKVWTALKRQGLTAFGQKISENFRHAGYMSELVMAQPQLHLVTPVTSNVCCFRIAPDVVESPNDRDGIELHASVAATMQRDGSAVLSTTTIDGQPCFRAAFTNHRTRLDDVEVTIKRVVDCVSELVANSASVR